MWKSVLSLVTLLVALSSCKHNHAPPSEVLQKAYAVQQEALKINKELDASVEALPPDIAQRKEEWLKNMIEIPGMDHDHSNCNHDHTRPTISITDEEMLGVQQAWLESIVDIAAEAKITVQ